MSTRYQTPINFNVTYRDRHKVFNMIAVTECQSTYGPRQGVKISRSILTKMYWSSTMTQRQYKHRHTN